MALLGDRVVAVSNASGLVVNGILLLEPAAGTCTYNQVSCG